MTSKQYVGSIAQHLPTVLQQLSASQIFVLVDSTTETLCLPHLRDLVPEIATIPHICIPAGERTKTIATTEYVWSKLLEFGADRKAVLLNLGGGVVTDLGGFAAGCYKRGIRFVHIPTTLLAQVDASIGGKTGVDFNDVKNGIGLFRMPEAVVVDPAFLSTLPDRELRSGMAEMYKHALIHDANHWEELKTLSPSQENLAELTHCISTSQQIKTHVVENDPFEQGLREALNYGHSAGHAIESYLLHTDTPALHGEAVAAGMICEAYLSEELCGLSTTEVQEIESVLLDVYSTLPLQVTDTEQLLHLAANDKKNRSGKLRMALLERIGHSRVGVEVSPQQLAQALERYIKLR